MTSARDEIALSREIEELLARALERQGADIFAIDGAPVARLVDLVVDEGAPYFVDLDVAALAADLAAELSR